MEFVPSPMQQAMKRHQMEIFVCPVRFWMVSRMIWDQEVKMAATARKQQGATTNPETIQKAMLEATIAAMLVQILQCRAAKAQMEDHTMVAIGPKEARRVIEKLLEMQAEMLRKLIRHRCRHRTRSRRH